MDEININIRAESGPRIVVIGGGTGLSTMLRGLKKYTSNLTAVVSVADDGGGSGVLRRELGMPPPGDLRNCIQALANAEPTMEDLFGYRFTKGSLSGQSLGNLFLAALNEMTGSLDKAVVRLSEVLAITGRVLPVTNENVRLVAEFADGSSVSGQSNITKHKRGADRHITRVRLVPENPPALDECIEAIENAEMIIFGPGSLYTSIIPNLLTAGVADAISKAGTAVKVNVMNLMTQDGETEGYTVTDHIKAMFDHAGGQIFDLCLVNSLPMPSGLLGAYRMEDAEPVAIDEERARRLGVELIYAPIADWSGGLARHRPDALARQLLRLYIEHAPDKVFRE